MPLPALLQDRLRLPVIAAPMFLASGLELVVAACRGGVVGAFPSVNVRPAEALDNWLRVLGEALTGSDAAPWAVNLIVHRSNPRLQQDLEACVRHRAPMVVTSVGDPAAIVTAVHSYGGIVFHDVTTLRHARKAAAAGVDGLILVCAGAGGHGGSLNPFAFLPQVRAFWAGPLALAGAISDGRGIHAARCLGADLAYMGTRFLATQESQAAEEHKRMICAASAADLLWTDAFTGIHGNYLRASIQRAGLDPDALPSRDGADLSKLGDGASKVWRDIWSAGQGVGAIVEAPPTADLIARLRREYHAAGGA